LTATDLDTAKTLSQIFTFGRYLKNRFGVRVGKIPINLSGFTCPNIDGTVAKGGCTFCLNESFSPNLEKGSDKLFLNLKKRENPILAQQMDELHRQIYFARNTMSAKQNYRKFIVYFQSYTNTYAPFDTLKTLYDRALEHKDVIGLSIGTRSDSITDETLEYLSELSKKYEIWIEYGIQSIYDETLIRINRGHDSDSMEKAIKKTIQKGLNVCGHLIFGLPGETESMMLNSARTAYEWGISSIKYRPLYVVKNTVLAREYKRGNYNPISFENYMDILSAALISKPPAISVQRITAGTDDGTLLAPEWCGHTKNDLMNMVRRALRKRGLKY